MLKLPRATNQLHTITVMESVKHLLLNAEFERYSGFSGSSNSQLYAQKVATCGARLELSNEDVE
ncbi:hypothetical protein ACVWYH_005049 [Bradyrhizobium sp. GM24.11]